MSDQTPWPTEAAPEDQTPRSTPATPQDLLGTSWAVPWPPSGAWCQFCWHNHPTSEHQHQGDQR